jgi:hypothetical protein
MKTVSSYLDTSPSREALEYSIKQFTWHVLQEHGTAHLRLVYLRYSNHKVRLRSFGLSRVSIAIDTASVGMIGIAIINYVS